MTIELLKVVQDGTERRYVVMAESLYDSVMPAIRKQMVQDGYEYYNVESLGGNYYRYLYIRRFPAKNVTSYVRSLLETCASA